MSESKQYRGSILTHDLFLGPLDLTYLPHQKRNGLTMVDSFIQSDPLAKNLSDKDIVIVFPMISPESYSEGNRSYNNFIYAVCIDTFDVKDYFSRLFQLGEICGRGLVAGRCK